MDWEKNSQEGQGINEQLIQIIEEKTIQQDGITLSKMCEIN